MSQPGGLPSTSSFLPQLRDAWYLRDHHPAKALERATVISTQLPDEADDLKACCDVILAYLDYLNNRNAEALQRASQAFEILALAPHTEWLPRICYVMGALHVRLGDTVQAAYYLEQQLKLSQRLNDQESEASAYTILGILHGAINPERAFAHFETALTISMQLHNSYLTARALNNIGVLHLHQEQFSAALSYGFKTLRASRGLPLLKVYAYSLIAQAYQGCGETTKALRVMHQAVAYAQQAVPSILARPLYLLGRIYLLAGRAEQAASQLKAAIEAANNDTQITLEGYQALAQCYAELGDYQAAYQHQRSYQQRYAETFSQESIQRIQALEVLHRTQVAQRETELERSKNQQLTAYVKRLKALNRRIKALSIRDPLTGLYNRRQLMRSAKTLCQQAIADNLPFSMVIIDVDSFKSINDTFGHQLGDTVLQQLARLFVKSMRQHDVLARYGGEEFAVIMPETPLQRALQACERLCERVRAHPWRELHPDLYVTVSVGIAALSPEMTLEALLRAADAKLYEAKRAGRNRICV
jgi:diguanylate cyclase (GGDEF)-like protein